MAEFEYDVFISYRSKDKAWVRGELLPRLEAAGLRACIDYRDFRPGAPILTEVERGLETSRRTVLVLTPDYLTSDWTALETLILQTDDPTNRELRLLPLMKEECDVPARIRPFVPIYFTARADPDESWPRLLAALGAPAP